MTRHVVTCTLPLGPGPVFAVLQCTCGWAKTIDRDPDRHGEYEKLVRAINQHEVESE